MKSLRLAILTISISVFAVTVLNPSRATSVALQGQPQIASNNSNASVIVYVSDFELDILGGRSRRNSSPRNSSVSPTGGTTGTSPAGQKAAPGSASNTPSSGRPSDAQSEETPTERADALVSAMSLSLSEALEKAGYKVRRWPAGSGRPSIGVRVRGVFAEPDEKNRVRRLLVGAEPSNPKMLVYVGVNNLSRPEQPLYELANPPSNDGRHGPVITITSYSPAARFEMARNPSDAEFKKVATEIAADLTSLLNANPMMGLQ